MLDAAARTEPESEPARERIARAVKIDKRPWRRGDRPTPAAPVGSAPAPSGGTLGRDDKRGLGPHRRNRFAFELIARAVHDRVHGERPQGASHAGRGDDDACRARVLQGFGVAGGHIDRIDRGELRPRQRVGAERQQAGPERRDRPLPRRVQKGKSAARRLRPTLGVHGDVELREPLARLLAKVVVAECGEKARVAGEARELDDGHRAAAGRLGPAVSGVDDLSGERHAVDAHEVDPFDVSDDGDAHRRDRRRRLSTTPLRDAPPHQTASLGHGMADWSTIASLSTAGGTLVLALATFSSVRASQRTARIAEQALLIGLRPVLAPTNEDDTAITVAFADAHFVSVPGGAGSVELEDGRLYFVIPLRNVGQGLAVLHSWRVARRDGHAAEQPAVESFRRLSRDLYIPAGGTGFWQGAIREADDGMRAGIDDAVTEGEPLIIDLLYGDYEGGQRTISRFSVARTDDDGWLAGVVRHWRLDGVSPRD